MKLLKKLLPIVTVASTVAIVAPIATSCGVKTFRYVFDEENPGEEFKPDEQIAEETETRISESKATQAYLRYVKKNKKILADDITYAQISSYLSRPDPENYEIEYGKSEVKIGNIEPETGKISKFAASMDILWLDTSAVLAKEHNAIIDFEIKNMEFAVYPEYIEVEPYIRWSVAPLAYYSFKIAQEYASYIEQEYGEEAGFEAYAGSLKVIYNYLKYDKTWSFKISLAPKKPATDTERIEWIFDSSIIEFGIDYINEKISGNFEQFLNITRQISFRSYYFANVVLA